MTIKHNQQVQHNHFRKDWQRRVRCHFDQPGSKKRRRNARHAKALKLAPRPVDKLRPLVHCPTIKYNRKLRAGRGFTLAELKAANIPRKFAPTVGIAVDFRRQNLSEESLALNVERLKAYKARLIVFPRKSGQFKNGDSSKEEIEAATSKEGGGVAKHVKAVVPLPAVKPVSEVKKGEMGEGTKEAYRTLRIARSDARLVGVREKREKAKAEEKDAVKK